MNTQVIVLFGFLAFIAVSGASPVPLSALTMAEFDSDNDGFVEGGKIYFIGKIK